MAERQRTRKYRYRDAYRDLRRKEGYSRVEALLLTLPATQLARMGQSLHRAGAEEAQKIVEAKERSSEIDDWSEVIGRDR